jgi:hypothetical protein
MFQYKKFHRAKIVRIFVDGYKPHNIIFDKIFYITNNLNEGHHYILPSVHYDYLTYLDWFKQTYTSWLIVIVSTI